MGLLSQVEIWRVWTEGAARLCRHGLASRCSSLYPDCQPTPRLFVARRVRYPHSATFGSSGPYCEIIELNTKYFVLCSSIVMFFCCHFIYLENFDEFEKKRAQKTRIFFKRERFLLNKNY